MVSRLERGASHVSALHRLRALLRSGGALCRSAWPQIVWSAAGPVLVIKGWSAVAEQPAAFLKRCGRPPPYTGHHVTTSSATRRSPRSASRTNRCRRRGSSARLLQLAVIARASPHIAKPIVPAGQGDLPSSTSVPFSIATSLALARRRRARPWQFSMVTKIARIRRSPRQMIGIPAYPFPRFRFPAAAAERP